MLWNKYKKGKNSKTLFYKFYDSELYVCRPSRESEFEYIPCREVDGHPMTQWNDIDRAYLVALKYLSQNINDGSMSPEDVKQVKDAVGRYESLCNRVNVLEQPPPVNIKKARGDSESHGYLAALFRELDAFQRRGASEVPEDLDIHDIPPELILQLMPLFSKKYEGINFSKLKCRMVV